MVAIMATINPKAQIEKANQVKNKMDCLKGCEEVEDKIACQERCNSLEAPTYNFTVSPINKQTR